MNKGRRFALLLGIGLAGLLLTGCAERSIPQNLQDLSTLAEAGGVAEVEVEVEGTEAAKAEVEVAGELTAMEAGSWTIAGQAFQITSSTEIKGDPAIGDLVKVHAWVENDGSLVAREIEPLTGSDDDSSQEDMTKSGEDELERTGIIESIASDTWIVDGFAFLVTPQTEIKGSFSVGDMVKVHLLPGEDGSWLAREIEPFTAEDESEDHDQNDDSDEFAGVIQELTDEYVVIDGMTFYFSDATEIKDALAVGDSVKVHFSVGDEGALLLDEIELHDGDSEDDMDDDSDDEMEDDSDEDIEQEDEQEGGKDDDNSGRDSDHDSNDEHQRDDDD